MVATSGFAGGPLAVSSNGEVVAYTTSPYGCTRDAFPTEVVVRNLKTDASHAISGSASDLALNANGTTLAAVTPLGQAAVDRIRLVRDAFHTTKLTAGYSVSCPTRNYCAEESPSFDSHNSLFYEAQISRSRNDACWVSSCSSWMYAIVENVSSRSHLLASFSRKTALTTSEAIDKSGDAVIFTLPSGRGRLAIWVWYSGRIRRMPQPGGSASDPTWW